MQLCVISFTLVVSTNSFDSVGLGSSPGLWCRNMISFVIWPRFYVFFRSHSPPVPARAVPPPRPARPAANRPAPRLQSALPVALAMTLYMSRFWIEKARRKHQKQKSFFISAIEFLAQVHTIQQKNTDIFTVLPTPLLNPEP